MSGVFLDDVDRKMEIEENDNENVQDVDWDDDAVKDDMMIRMMM